MSANQYREAFEAAEAAITQWGLLIDVATGHEEESFNGTSRLLELDPRVVEDVDQFWPSSLGHIATMQAQLYPRLADEVPSMIGLTCDYIAAAPLGNDDDVVELSQSYLLSSDHTRNRVLELAGGPLVRPDEHGKDKGREPKGDEMVFATLALASTAHHYPHVR